MDIAKRILVSGIVQGVGFRPFIFRLANDLKLRGYVRNLGGSDVEIVVEGTEERVNEFIRSIKEKLPPAAKIDNIIIERVDLKGFKGFKILKSGREAKLYSMIPPDFGICEFCLREILDPSSRFYMYPFHSCAWCGPRFSIIEEVPYDRENTSMRDFPLCEKCIREYEDPNNIRRFHIQGISCPECGPKVWLTDRFGREIDIKNPILEASKLIDEGFIVAIKGLGGFHIAALATDDDVVLKLRERKRRRYKPFALMALDIETAEKIVYVDDKAKKLLLSTERPIILLPEKEDSPVSKYVAPGLDKQGIMLPYTGLHYLLLMSTRDRFLIMTSGNKKGKPMCTDEKCAFERLRGFVDYFLLHNRRIINRVDDSVVRFTDGEITILRRGRGYAPIWIKVPFKFRKTIIAFGAELQNAGAVGFDDKIVLTQYIGDTDEVENLDYLERALKFFMKVYRINPKESIIASDLHPMYATTALAEKWSSKYNVDLLKIQHHFAHIVSVMAEKRLKLDEEVLGIAIDGLGYGDDGTIWGGEVLKVSYIGYTRIGHLEYHPMPGGDLAVYYPIRMLVGILSKFLSHDEILELFKKKGLIKYMKGGEKELQIIFKQTKIAPRTSSMGRVLDAVSALLGICYERTYEGEPAMKLEASAKNGELIDPIEIPIKWENGLYTIKTTEIFVSVLENIDQPLNNIAYTVQYKLGEALGFVAAKSAEKHGIDKIIVSGGAAVNSYIVRGIKKVAKEFGKQVLLPNKVPAGDGGIALGQVAISGARSIKNA